MAAGAHDSAGSESVRGVMAIVIGVVPPRTDFCGVDFGVDLVTSDVTGVSQLPVTIRALALALARAQNKHQLQDHGLPQRS